ncbi:MAG: alkaline phosphatase PhoX [Verrucomicrobiaceae bacterium]
MQRRSFLSTTATATAGFLGLQKYLHAQSPDRLVSPYGPLLPDPEGILDLPEGFKYQIISKAGGTMSDGLTVPGKPDGMACFPGRENTVILVRNHELGLDGQAHGPFPDQKPPKDFDKKKSYDFGRSSDLPHVGGTSTIVYDPVRGEVLREFLSLTGTDRNCAGGSTPWGSWVTCEEPTDLTSERGQLHGYCFEVKATDDGELQQAVPLKGLGRFRHEAIAVDPNTGFVYITEDTNDGLLYRFIPNQKGDLSKGKLQALAIEGNKSADLRNYSGTKTPIKEGEPMKATWIDMSRVEAPDNDLRYRGFRKGAARFARGEGIDLSNGSFYICCTDGGAGSQGQVFKLTPSGSASQPDTIELFLQPEESDLLTNGDNLCSSPWGDLIICEDLVAEHSSKTPHLRGITPEGKIYTLARNAISKSEFAGSCFSPDGSILFVNMQGQGYTLAITGPWQP